MFSALIPFRIGELMQEFRCGALVQIISTMQALATGPRERLKVADELREQGVSVTIADNTEAVAGPHRDGMRAVLEALKVECKKLELRASLVALQRLLDGLDETPLSAEWFTDKTKDLVGRLQDELTMTCCVALDLNDQQFLVNRAFGDEVADLFPHATMDIDEAGACIALGRFTASAFHLMRVLEHGLHALQSTLSVTIGKNWEPTLNQIDGAIKKLPHDTDERRHYNKRLFEASAHLRNVKYAWRNDTMHPNRLYTREQAVDIWNHCKAFMISLAPIVGDVI